MMMASVLELFSCRKFSFIHAFISSRQVVMVDDDADGADGNGVDNRGFSTFYPRPCFLSLACAASFCSQ